jgi:hypothetical protein
LALEVPGLELPDGYDRLRKQDAVLPVLLHQLSHAGSPLLSGAGHGFEACELVSHLGFPTYCGIAEFTYPHLDAVILPPP